MAMNIEGWQKSDLLTLQRRIDDIDWLNKRFYQQIDRIEWILANPEKAKDQIRSSIRQNELELQAIKIIKAAKEGNIEFLRKCSIQV